jgi:magnesium transporter
MAATGPEHHIRSRACQDAQVRAACPQSIANYVVKTVPVARLAESVGAARNHLFDQRYGNASHVFLLDPDDYFVDAIEIADLIAADESRPIVEVSNRKTYPAVDLGTDREEAASVAIRSGVSTLAVSDAEGRFVGAVPADALMSILRDEHLEDLHHMVGILSRSEAAKEALTGPPHRRAFYRMPWLLIGMVGSAAATAIMAQFESALAAHIAVAFFIPAIVYLADAVGTQSEAVAVRGLSLAGAEIGPLLAGEVGTGVLIGAMLAGIAFPLVWLGFGSMSLATTVALALAAASSVATTTGFLLPWLFGRVGYDPALGAGPVGTVMQDIISLSIYFLIATLLVF